MQDEFSKDYNQLSGISFMSYNILSFLMKENENLWKILKYSSSDALQKANLTLTEKRALIYNGGTDMSTYRAFMIDLIPDIFTPQCAIIQIYPTIIVPDTAYLATATFQINLFCHATINQLSLYKTRTTTMLEEVIKTLNGQDIGGVGKLVFAPDSKRKGGNYSQANLTLSNLEDYSGYALRLMVGIG